MITPAFLFGYRVAAFELKIHLNSVVFMKFHVFFMYFALNLPFLALILENPHRKAKFGRGAHFSNSYRI